MTPKLKKNSKIPELKKNSKTTKLQIFDENRAITSRNATPPAECSVCTCLIKILSICTCFIITYE